MIDDQKEPPWSAIWGESADRPDQEALKGAPFIGYVLFYVFLVFMQEIFLDPFAGELGLPVGTYLRFFYYTFAGMTLVQVFYIRNQRRLDSAEVSALMQWTVMINTLSNIAVLYLLPVIYDTGFTLGFGFAALFGLFTLLAFDVLMLFLAWRYPVRFFSDRVSD
ncbi:MAG: hypothetical protein AAF578_09115 [Pseudomonadota bacterium]